jgi:Fe2+ transport system protein FeoA
VKKAPITRLSMVPAGQTVQLVDFETNGRSVLRLAELGLNPETCITVLKSVPGQPMIILVRGTQLAIDHRTARYLRVRVIGDVPRGGRPRWHRRGRGRRGRRRWWW